MRAVWAIAAILLAAAVTAVAWSPGREAQRSGMGGAVGAAEGPTARGAQPERSPTAGAPIPSVCPMPPESSLPAVAPSKALEELLGGSLVAAAPAAPAGGAPPATGMPPATAAPSLTVGTAAVVERVDDRTVKVDGRYMIRGSGTEADPFAVSWELLGSAAQTVDAARGRFEIPGRIADLRGAWVRISGYWAPPLMVFEAREAMVMLNRWDGCCVGLPPTPFDSIEATFVRPIPVQGQHLFRFGTVKGRLSVEPFTAGTFLLGLYRLEDAVMETSS